MGELGRRSSDCCHAVLRCLPCQAPGVQKPLFVHSLLRWAAVILAGYFWDLREGGSSGIQEIFLQPRCLAYLCSSVLSLQLWGTFKMWVWCCMFLGSESGPRPWRAPGARNYSGATE